MNEETKKMLEMFRQPAFFVEQGVVRWVNTAGRTLAAVDMDIRTVLREAGVMYDQWDHRGSLQLSLQAGGLEYDAFVRPVEAGELFVLSTHATEEQLSATAVMGASVALRRPLQELIAAAREVFDELEDRESAATAAAELNRSIYRLLRLCGQMSDGGELMLHRKKAHRSPADLRDFLKNFYAQALPLVESAQRKLVLKLPDYSCGGDVDTALLERALYNLLSNALGHTPRGGEITLSLEKKERRFFFRVSDNGEGVSQNVLGGGFHSDPVGDPRQGLGVGLSMVREIARLHDGGFMLGSNLNGGTVATFSVSAETTVLELWSRVLRYDYCGSFHHGLVELSEVLDTEQYHPTEVL